VQGGGEGSGCDSIEGGCVLRVVVQVVGSEPREYFVSSDPSVEHGRDSEGLTAFQATAGAMLATLTLAAIRNQPVEMRVTAHPGMSTEEHGAFVLGMSKGGAS
jgi:hypothetical protein